MFPVTMLAHGDRFATMDSGELRFWEVDSSGQPQLVPVGEAISNTGWQLIHQQTNNLVSSDSEFPPNKDT